MSEETTQDLRDKRPFEERVLARLDSFDARFDAIDTRFDSIDARFIQIDSRFDVIDARLEKLESRSYDTKPIWERALKAIMDTGREVGEIKNKVGVIETKVGLIETKVEVLETKVQAIEKDINVIKTDQRSIRNELVDVRRGLKHHVGERLDMILKLLFEDRNDIRDAETRIRELESKLA